MPLYHKCDVYAISKHFHLARYCHRVPAAFTEKTPVLSAITWTCPVSVQTPFEIRPLGHAYNPGIWETEAGGL